VQQRIADELPRTVEGDVAAPVGPFEVGADLTGDARRCSVVARTPSV
jgi:hypothetical protein